MTYRDLVEKITQDILRHASEGEDSIEQCAISYMTDLACGVKRNLKNKTRFHKNSENQVFSEHT